MPLTQPGIDVAENPGWLDSDGVDIRHRLHINALLPQDGLDAIRLSQDTYWGREKRVESAVGVSLDATQWLLLLEADAQGHGVVA